MRLPSTDDLRSFARRAAGPISQRLQTALAATLAWYIANWVGGHDNPFFAPIAAVVAMSQPLGERGLHAIRLVVGVVLGIVVGELVVAGFGSGYWQLGVAVFVAMAIAVAAKGPRPLVVQAGVSAILTIVVADGQYGVHRLVDALIGAAVALVFSQLLFAPEPVRLIRRASAVVLERMAAGLHEVAEALRSGREVDAEVAMTTFRQLRDDLAELSRTREVGVRVRRHAPMWRSRSGPVVREHENAGQLDLLGDSLILLSRTSAGATPPEREVLAPWAEELADTIAELADDPGSRKVRQLAVDRAIDVARSLAPLIRSGHQLPAYLAMQMVTTDLLVFSGVEPHRARAAVAEGTGQFSVVAPPTIARLPFAGDRLVDRLGDRRAGRMGDRHGDREGSRLRTSEPPQPPA